jgi:replication-associated recombination protein RarA
MSVQTFSFQTTSKELLIKMINYKEKLTALMQGNKTKSVIKQDLSDRFSELDKSLALFHRIYGHQNIKENVYRALTVPRQINILLVGPPGCAKTLFTQIVQEQCNDVIFFDAATSSGAGLIEILHANQHAKVLVIDEIDKLKKNDLNCLLGLLNNGIVNKTLKNVVYNFVMKITVIATSNSNAKLTPAVRSRFQEYKIKPYSDEDYINVVKFCLKDRNDLGEGIPEIIAKILLAHEKKDVRLAISIANLVKQRDTEEDIIRVIENNISEDDEEDIDYN